MTKHLLVPDAEMVELQLKRCMKRFCDIPCKILFSVLSWIALERVSPIIATMIRKYR